MSADRNEAYLKYLWAKADACPPRERPLTPGPAEMMEAGHRCFQCAFDMLAAIYGDVGSVPEQMLIELGQTISWSLDVSHSLREALPDLCPGQPPPKPLDTEPGEC